MHIGVGLWDTEYMRIHRNKILRIAMTLKYHSGPLIYKEKKIYFTSDLSKPRNGCQCVLNV